LGLPQHGAKLGAVRGAEIDRAEREESDHRAKLTRTLSRTYPQPAGAASPRRDLGVSRRVTAAATTGQRPNATLVERFLRGSACVASSCSWLTVSGPTWPRNF